MVTLPPLSEERYVALVAGKDSFSTNGPVVEDVDPKVGTLQVGSLNDDTA
jgi:hypothetical protein